MSVNLDRLFLKIEIIVIGCFLLFNLSKIDLFLENIVITDTRLKETKGICENPQKMRHYLQNGGDPNLKFYRLIGMHSGGGDWDEYTPLFCSVFQSDEDNLKILIDQGAELNYVNYRCCDNSLTALEQAIFMGNIKITKLLIDAGASINLPEEETGARESPIFIAVKEGHREIVELLISHQVDIDIKDAAGRTIFDYAKDPYILDLLNKYNE